MIQTANASLFIQFITGIIDVYGLSIKVPENKKIFRELLQIELTVQTIEFIYYSWMVKNITKIKNITPTRYFDWFITTPTMLITLMAYLDTSNSTSTVIFLKNHTKTVYKVLFLNILMLLLGLAGELGYINMKTSVFIGFIPFVMYFEIIYTEFVNNNKLTKDQIFIYWFFFLTWSLYGIAALFSYETKNSMYNILDLFAKNFLGIFLVYILWTHRI
jgi:bacteriorhodopsin